MMLDIYCVMHQGHTKKVYGVLIELYPASGMQKNVILKEIYLSGVTS